MTHTEKTSEFDEEINEEMLFGQEFDSDKPSGLFTFTRLSRMKCLELEEIVRIEKWFDVGNGRNQKMSFGFNSIPKKVLEIISNHVTRDCGSRSIPSSLVLRMSGFDQMISNSYSIGDSVKDHVDLPHRFDDGILILNLTGSACMTFKHTLLPSLRHDIHLLPGDIIYMTGSSRYDWTHGIEEIKGTRISITLRKLLLDKEGICM